MTHEEALKRKTEKAYVHIMKKHCSEELTPEFIRQSVDRLHRTYVKMVLSGGEGVEILNTLAFRDAWKRVALEKGLEIDFSGQTVKIKSNEGMCENG